MKKSSVIFWGIIIGALVALNIFSFYQRSDMALDIERTTDSLKTVQQSFKLLKEKFVSHTIMQLRDEGSYINGDLDLTAGTKQLDHYKLKDLLSDEYNYIFDFTEINCRSCLAQEIKFIKDFAKSVGSEHVIILAQYDNQSDLDVFKRLNQLKLKVYNKNGGNLGLALERENVPFMFLTRSDLIARYVFVPDKKIPVLSRRYYNLIKDKVGASKLK